MLGGIVRGRLTTLRTPAEGDLALLDALMADMRVRRERPLLGEPATLATWKERLTEAAKERDAVLWAIEADGRAVGFTRVQFGHEEPRHADLSQLVIDPALWGRGLGSDAALALHRYLFDYLDKRVVALDLSADNARAQRIAQRLGYSEFGRGHDVRYREGAYVDQVHLRFDRETWDARWASEHEYAPFPDGIER